MRSKTLLILFFCLVLPPLKSIAQPNGFKDSLDGKMDVSDWVLDFNGFIPVPTLITEPALGNIGGGLFSVFIDKNDPYIDTVGNEIKTERVRPDLYGIGGAYTANGTWLIGGGSGGVIQKWRAKYRLMGGYANVNLDFYKEFKNGDTHAFEFNLRTVPVTGYLIKQIGRSHWYAGLNYLYLNTEVKQLNAEFFEPEIKKASISRIGILAEYDGRDNIFTPDNGFRFNTQYSISDEGIGSDFNYDYFSTAAYYYFRICDKLINGLRAEYTQVWGNAPFYMLPFINLRGIPVARYQGDRVGLAETEFRWDFNFRWSLVFFGGAGKAVPENFTVDEADWQGAGGAGFRYLMARKLKLRMGVDIAHGPEDFAYYIVFGTNWVR